jgi:3-hydroxyisobutyrate dehydrogenase
MRAPIGFVGVGNMGLAMALRLRGLGHDVRVRDIDPAREALARAAGAAVCISPAALAADCATVIVVVVDAVQTGAVLFGPDGLASAPRPDACVILCPTIAPDDTESFAARLAALGVACIDAPMSGGPVRARDGTMSLMVACRDAVFDAQRALLDALSSQVFRVSERPGDGARTKLVNNLLAAVNLAGAAEALALAERVGLDPATVQAVIARSSGQSWIGSDRMPRALQGDLVPRAHTTLLRKDSALAMAMARAAGFDAALGARAADVFAAACAAGCAELDDASLLGFARGRAGLGEARGHAGKIPVPPPAVGNVARAAHAAGAADAAGAASASFDTSQEAHPTLDAAAAASYAECALQTLATPYPYALQHLMRGPGDRPTPEAAHPLFHGSFDWHSSVHMQASLARLLRLEPGLPQGDAIAAHFTHRFTPSHVAVEHAHLAANPGFERPYGWAWLLRLQDELRAWARTRPQAAPWADALEPLVVLVRTRWIDFLAVAPQPQRAGAHTNSAFAMTLALEHARGRGDSAFAAALEDAAWRWYGADARYPAAYEPSANDFLSPGLCAAVLMQALLAPDAWRAWWAAYRPEPEALGRWLVPATVGSRTDPQLVHADGLNLSRAWCLGRLAPALPEGERAAFRAARAAHLRAAMPHVVGGDYVATHWLVSYAVLALTDGGPGGERSEGASP